MSHPATVRDEDIPAHVYERRWYILGVLCTSLLLIVLANTSMNVALPTMARELGLSSSAQQWVVDAYSLVFAGLLFTTGTSAIGSAARVPAGGSRAVRAGLDFGDVRGRQSAPR